MEWSQPNLPLLSNGDTTYSSIKNTKASHTSRYTQICNNKIWSIKDKAWSNLIKDVGTTAWRRQGSKSSLYNLVGKARRLISSFNFLFPLSVGFVLQWRLTSIFVTPHSGDWMEAYPLPCLMCNFQNGSRSKP
jgi:hypothetical protein